MLETLKEKWNGILKYLKEEYDISDVSFDTWLLPLEVYALEQPGNIVKIIVPDANFLGYIKKKYSTMLMVSIAEVTGIKCDSVQFLVEEDIVPEPAASNQLIQNNTNTVSPATLQNANLNPKYTFDTFVVGANNNLAHAASLAVAESPGEIYNPLFIYGGVGLGKTHLMHSIANFILKNNPKAKILYVTSEKFTNELIDAIRNKNNISTTEFREKYRNNDVLLIDDIQFIIGKEATQQEFFFTFSHLTDSKKQVIISSDKHPSTMTTLDERFRSRFEMGITVDVKAPTYETRMAILRSKVDQENIHIDDSILDFIASNIISNIRELQGAINKVISFSSLCGKEVTMDLAKEALSDKINPDIKRPITIDYILETVADHFGITVKDILSNKRSSNIAYPRHICMYICRELTTSPLAEIGNKLGNRHHSTVLHSVEIIENKIAENDAETIQNIDVLKKKIDPQ